MINDAFEKIVNEVMAKEEQTWKTKVQLLDLANKDLVEMIQMRKAKKLQVEDETRQVTKYILNDVINAAVAQKVNQDIAKKERKWKKKVQQLDLANTELKKIEKSVARINILTQKHKGTEETTQELGLQNLKTH